ncbi:2-oxoacid:acceptor oxidoreductase subunit alpha [candidate division KSB1 bacterium]|nr:MAG: 2-oxoacid:acceptor oxidoreductase subunit alpha [candidate division KSB1 bacterium]
MEKKEFKSDVDFTVRIGGEGGDGVISCGELFAKAAARTEFHVFTYITYPAEMRGGFSMIQIRVRDWTIYSMGSEVDYLVVFNQEAYDNTISDLKKGGMIIYDPDAVEVDESLDAVFFPVQLTKLANEATGYDLGKNVVALGMLGSLFNISKSVLQKLIKDRYGSKGTSVIEKNMSALEKGYVEGEKQSIEKKFHLKTENEKPTYMMLSGNEAVALGAIAAGCRFVAGYPITPATPIFETLTKLMPKVGGRAIQMEDEIASISALIGASFAGEKVITPTSGPGLQLMGEQLNLASMLELPMVIVDVQRGGPSTGLPTKTEQSDLKFAIYGTAGESPRCILAPTSVEDCFYQTIRAFNIAEKYQMPVILLTDQSIGYRKATVKIPDFSHIVEIFKDNVLRSSLIPSAERMEIVTRVIPEKEELEGYKRFKFTETGVSPVSVPGMEGGQYVATGLAHNEVGKADYSPKNHLEMTRKRFKKLKYLSKAFDQNPPEFYGSVDSEIGIIGWGSTEGAIREARYLAEEKGIMVRHLHPKEISPLPEKQIRHFLVGLKQIIVVEENYTGQFAHFIKAKFGVHPIELHKCEGSPISSREIMAVIEKVARITDEEHITEL